MRDMRNQYPFRGDEEIDLNEAMQLMDQMQSMDELERQLERTQYGGDIDDIDAEKLEELLGDEARETLDQLKQFLEVLENAGYIRKKGNSWELTPRGTRKIGQKRARRDLRRSSRRTASASTRSRDSGTRRRAHATRRRSTSSATRSTCDIEKTIMNSMLARGPAACPIRLKPDDFEVYRSEHAHADGDRDDARPVAGRWRCAAASRRRRRSRWRSTT